MNSSEKAEIQSSGENDIITEASKNSQVTFSTKAPLLGIWKGVFLLNSKCKEVSSVFRLMSKGEEWSHGVFNGHVSGFVAHWVGFLHFTWFEQ